MRALLITDWPALEAGTERYIELLREGLESAGDEVRLLTASVGSAAGGTAEFVARASNRRSVQALQQIVNPDAALTSYSAVRRFRPDVVHAAMILPYLSPVVLAPMASIPTTLAVVDYKPVCPVGTKLLPDQEPCLVRAGVPCWRNGCLGTARALRDAVRYAGFHAALRNVDRVVACSAHMKAELTRAGIESVHVDHPVRAPRTDFHRRPAEAPTFVYAGRLAPVKGVDLLLRAFARLHNGRPDVRLLIHGDGPMRDELRALTGNLGIQEAVSFEFTMAREWTHVLSSAWALVVPSTYREPLGFIAIEAVVHGVPVIASAGGGLGETIDHGRSGLLFPNGEESALLDRMTTVCSENRKPPLVLDPARARAFAERHSVSRHVREMRGIWESIDP